MRRGQNPKSLANLKPPIKPGEVRNPEGINRRRPITDEYWQVSPEPMPLALIRKFNKRCGAKLLVEGDSWARGVAVRLQYEASMRGEVRAAKEMREAMEGKAPQRPEITAPVRTEVVLVVRYYNRKDGRYTETRQDGSHIPAELLQ
ncbi:MAG: hypothetical protein ABR973_12440 [Candidatus Acidiferrales bacterium]|jgi:hypothetical protein